MDQDKPSSRGHLLDVCRWLPTVAGAVLLVSGALVVRAVGRSGPPHQWWGWILSVPVLVWWVGCATFGVWVERLRHPHAHRPLGQFWAFTVLVAAAAAGVTTPAIHVVALVARTAGPIPAGATLFGSVFLCAGAFVGLLFIEDRVERWSRRK